MQFPFHRTTRPIKKVAVEQTESGSSDEENDDEDGFEILTAEKLFSTLLQRVSLNGRWNQLDLIVIRGMGFFFFSAGAGADKSRECEQQQQLDQCVSQSATHEHT